MLSKSPNHRHQALRRWALVACAMLGLALASGLIGAVNRQNEAPAAPTQTGPFSYFPS